ncbi:MAG: FecR domain-containing protein [Aestuariivirgaceae bacterium]
MRRLFASLALALMAITVSTHSAPRSWLVQKTSGNAVYGAQSAALTRGLVLNRGATVRTGDNGKVLLVRSTESVFIGPYTVAAIATHPTNGLETTVLLQRGQTRLSVHKRNAVHFSVETPYLVAVVKGTKFEVSVGRNSAMVSVQEGRVGVKALRSGKYADVLAGQRASVDAAGNLKLTGKGKLAAIQQGRPRPAAVSAGSASASVGSSVSSQGTSLGLSAGTGGLSVGAGTSVGGIGVGASAGVGGTGVSVGGVVRVGS